MSSIKKYWGYFISGLVAMLGVLAYIINLKNKKINSLTAQAKQTDTKNKVTKIDGEIKKLKEDKNIT